MAAAVVTVSEHAHAAGLAALTAAGGRGRHLARRRRRTRAPSSWCRRRTSSLDGILGIGGRPGAAARGRGRSCAPCPTTSMVVAVDLPSGVDPARARSPAPSTVFADETVTFGVAKPVHLLPATEPAGRGARPWSTSGVEPSPGAPGGRSGWTHDDVAALWPVPGPADDKYSRGVLGVVAGGRGLHRRRRCSASPPPSPPAPGWCATSGRRPRPRWSAAAVPGGRARRRAGAGLAGRAGARPRRRRPSTAGRSATPRWTPWPRASRASWTPAALDLLERGPAARADPAHAARRRAGPAARPGWTGRSSAPTVDGRARCRHARRLAELTGATVLLKGATTLVVDPAPAALVRSQADAPPWMATAGSGDVLAGLAGTLLAAGLSPLDAGSAGGAGARPGRRRRQPRRPGARAGGGARRTGGRGGAAGPRAAPVLRDWAR